MTAQATDALHPNLRAVMQTMDGLFAVLGSRSEVILHDFSQMEHSIVAICGSVTNRQIGGPPTNFLLQKLRKEGDAATNSLNYRTVLPDGRELRSSTMFIRDDNGGIIGSLCINQDMTDYTLARKLLAEISQFAEAQPEAHPGEQFARDISEVTGAMLQEEIQALNKPVAYLQKEEKLCLVRALDDKGFFDVRGAVEQVAEELGVTNFTVYNYLKEIRGSRK